MPTSPSTPENAVPVNRLEGIRWCLARITQVSLEAGGLGVTSKDAADFDAATVKANASNDKYERLRREMLAAGQQARADWTALRKRANGVVADGRFTASQSEDPAAVLALADLPARRPGSPAKPPAQPLNLRCTLNNDGTNTLTWDGRTEQTFFTIQRQLVDAAGAQSGWETLLAGHARPFRDETIPLGTAAVNYRVQALRAGQSSPWSEPGRLQLVATTPVTQAPLKIAA